MCRHLQRFCAFLFVAAPHPNSCIPSQFASWPAHPFEPPSESYVSALHDMWSTNTRKLLKGHRYKRNHLVSSTSFKTMDSFLPYNHISPNVKSPSSAPITPLGDFFDAILTKKYCDGSTSDTLKCRCRARLYTASCCFMPVRASTTLTT